MSWSDDGDDFIKSKLRPNLQKLRPSKVMRHKKHIKEASQNTIDSYFQAVTGKTVIPDGIEIPVITLDGDGMEEIKTETNIGKISPKKRSSPIKNTPVTPKKMKSPEESVKKVESPEKFFDALRFMIVEVNHNQDLIRRANGQNFEPLLDEEEQKFLKIYLSLPATAQHLYLRRYFGVVNWHPAAEDPEAVSLLEEQGFVTTDMSNLSLKTLLQPLNSKELIQLGKKFVGNVPGNKKSITGALLKSVGTQKSVSDFFSGSRTTSREKLIQQEILKMLGKRYCVSDPSRRVMDRVVILFTTVHYVQHEGNRAANARFLISNILRRITTFMPYEITPFVLFETRGDFREYENALKLRGKVDLFLQLKDHVLLGNAAESAIENLKRLVADDGFMARFEKLPSFLKRYSSLYIYTSITTRYYSHFKRQQVLKNVIPVLEMLLQLMVLTDFGFRGDWYEMLIQAYLAEKKTEEAKNVVHSVHLDDTLDEVDLATLRVKSDRLIKDKKLDSSLDEAEEQVMKITIQGRAIPDNAPGSKLVYVEKTGNEVRYTSVEEFAISHYKTQGFPNGCHAEGRIVTTLFHILFFDIIYMKVPGVFLSPFQEHPLDHHSPEFYKNRQQAIEKRLSEMIDWNENDITSRILNIYAQYHGINCIIKWDNRLPAEAYIDIAICIGINGLRKLCEHFAMKPHLAKSGFPDLTLWNTITKNYRFVEVKSPNDRLLPNQKVWLKFLTNNDFDVEMCFVKS